MRSYSNDPQWPLDCADNIRGPHDESVRVQVLEDKDRPGKRRKRAREPFSDLLSNDSSDSSLLAKPAARVRTPTRAMDEPHMGRSGGPTQSVPFLEGLEGASVAAGTGGMVDGGGKDEWDWGDLGADPVERRDDGASQVFEGPRLPAVDSGGRLSSTVGTGFSTSEDSYWKSCNYTYTQDEWHGVRSPLDGHMQPDRRPNMTDADYMQFLDAEARRYMKHIGWEQDALNAWGPPITYSNDADLAAGRQGVGKGTQAPTTGRARREYLSDHSLSDGDQRDSALTESLKVMSAPAAVAQQNGPLPCTQGEVDADQKALRFKQEEEEQEEEEDEEAKEEQEWTKQGSPRWLIRALEGDSSDTWVDDTGKRRRRGWADPFERAADLGLAEHMGLVPGSKPGKGVGIGHTPVVKDEADLWDRGWGVNEFRQVDVGQFVRAPSMQECKDETKALIKRAIEAKEENHEIQEQFNSTYEGGGGNRTGYFGLLSDLNWSPKERVLYDIPADPQSVPVHLFVLHPCSVVFGHAFSKCHDTGALDPLLCAILT